MTRAALVLAGCLVSAAIARAEADGPAAATASQPTPAPAATDGAPTPSVFDRYQDSQALADGRSMASHVVRTALALGFVVALIYLLAKVALPRLLNGLGQGSGRHLRVVERIALDPKHSLVLVDVADGVRLLLGTGEGHVQLLAELPGSPGSGDFRSAMGDASRPGGGGGGDFPGKGGGRNVKAN